MPKVVSKLPEKPEDYHPQSRPRDSIIHDITFFGDSSIPEGSKVYNEVFEAAKLLAQNGFAIVNGGGPGVMKAATDGAESVDGETTAIYWEPKLASIFEGKNVTNLTDASETYSNYVMRTFGLIEKGQVFVVCKGGTGTISEFGMVWALAKLYYGKHKPVILFGDFWKDIVEGLQKGMLLDDNELGVLHYAETPEDVLKLVELFEIEVQARAQKTYEGDETPFVLAPKLEDRLQKHLVSEKGLNLERVVNTTTQRQLEEFRDLVQSPARVLDIGAGAGYDLSFLSQFYSVTGIEIDKEVAKIASFENPNADILEMDIMDYEIQENVFKGIWARDILHHLTDEQLAELMPRLQRGLVPGGVLFMIVREGEGSAQEPDMVGGEEVMKMYNYFSESELNDMADKYGFDIVNLEHVERSHRWLAAALRKPE